MAFIPVTTESRNARSVANFQELAIYFNTPYEEAVRLLDLGMSFEDIQEYKRSLNGFGSTRIQ